MAYGIAGSAPTIIRQDAQTYIPDGQRMTTFVPAAPHEPARRAGHAGWSAENQGQDGYTWPSRSGATIEEYSPWRGLAGSYPGAPATAVQQPRRPWGEVDDRTAMSAGQAPGRVWQFRPLPEKNTTGRTRSQTHEPVPPGGYYPVPGSMPVYGW